MSGRFHDVVSAEEFQLGVKAGLMAAAVLLGWLAALGRTRVGARAVLAFGFVPAATYALAEADHVKLDRGPLLLGVAVVVAAGVLPALARLPFWTGIPVAAAGALVLSTDWKTTQWESAALVAMVALVGPCLVDVDRRWPGAAGALVVLAAAGLYVTLPDTEAALAFLGAVAPMAMFGWPLFGASLGVFAGGFAALSAEVIATGGIGRATSVVGAVAALGLVVGEPIASRVKRRFLRRQPAHVTAMLRLLAIDALVVLVCTRVAGLRDDVSAAIGLGVAAVVVGVLLLPVTPEYR